MGSVARAQDARSIGGTVQTIDGTPLAEAVRLGFSANRAL